MEPFDILFFFFWLRDRDLFAMGEDAMEVVVEEEEEV